MKMVGDFFSFQNGYAFKSKDFVREGKYKIVKIKELKDGLVKFFDDTAEVNLPDNFEFDKYIIQKGDVLFALTGDPVNKPNPLSWVGRVAYYNYDEPALLNQRVCKAIPKTDIPSDFLYYFFRQNREFYRLASKATGSASQANISTKTIEQHNINIPDIENVKTIVTFLKNIDDKISYNNRINRNLYEQAVALFEAMYQGYPVKKIGELDIFVTDYVANGSFASLKENVTILEEKNYAYFVRNVDLKAKEFPRFVNQHSYEFLSKSKLVGGEVIISNVGDVGSVFLCPKLDGPMTLGNNMIMLTSPKHNNYLYLFFKSYIGQGKIGGITGGSAQPKFNKTDFKSLEINYPDESQVDEFNEKTSALLDMISKLDEENKQLTALRDSLLPKLMSGELDVSDLDI
jgi:type I restriction enzyme S subunit